MWLLLTSESASVPCCSQAFFIQAINVNLWSAYLFEVQVNDEFPD
jgi:hypothetical protein